jgi:DNA polymerase elongation subunit (family B)
MNTPIHIFDAIARDQKVIRATEDTIEVEYSDADSDGSTSFRKSRKDKSVSANREMVIHLFGTDPTGRSVRIEVNGFRPFFYVALPSSECETPTKESYAKTKIQDAICSKTPKELQAKYKFELVRKQKLFGYTGGKLFPFLKVSVPSLGMFYELRKILLDPNQKPKLRLSAFSPHLEVFESNIDPMLRFFHIRDIQPCGWICVKGSCVGSLGDEDAGDIVRLQADWEDVSPASAPAGIVTAPFKHAFWDIECYSHDKEFPMAQQGYRRVTKQLWSLASQDVARALKEGFAALRAGGLGQAQVKIPPLKKARLVPTEKEIATRVDSESFQESIAEIWRARDGITVKERESRLAALTTLLDRTFGKIAAIAGDPVIQIGTVSVCGPVVEKHIFVLGGCGPLPGMPEAKVHTFKTESEMLLAWFQWVVTENFDVFSGYNIFGFDERYMWDRLVELGLEGTECVQRLTRLFDEGGEMKLQEKFLSSSALGDNMLYMWNTPGRLRVDLYGHIKRKVQLASYKLDSVCAAFLSGKLGGIQATETAGRWLLKTKQKGDARVGRYVQILNDLGEDLTEKMIIAEVVDNGIVVVSEENVLTVAAEGVKWAIVKDDVSPQELFRLHRGTDEDRARIAAYCIQDCDLVYELYKKLEVFNEAMSMANVCSVPVSYIFTRGQGIKIESLIFKDCMLRNQLIVVQPQAAFGSTGSPSAAEGAGGQEEEGYEGAIVLDPVPGFYTDAPVGVCDFASLYPSTIISENISHDMLVWTKDYDLTGKLVCIKYGSVEAERLAPAGTRWTDIEFDILRPDPADTHKHPKKIRMGTRICRFAQPAAGVKGSLPQIVAKLLAARKAKRAEIPKTDDPFKKALLDAEQNAYKVTANSLYGQLGSRTFKMRLQDLGASVTAYARKQIMFSKAALEEFYGPAAADPRCSAEVVYGDTDSLFVAFNPKDPATGQPLTGREAIVKTIELTEEAGHFITGALRAPHDFEYDKVFYPFIIFSKKRYVGNKYEESPDEFKETSMGIVLKRRDNAPLLKMIYSGAIDFLMNRRDVAGAVEFVRQKVQELVEGRIKLSQLTITKSLAAEYACSPPAHKVLADRIMARDPGNAPSSGDRIGFVYVKAAAGQQASKLQGDRVETPAWIEEHGLKADAEYYIEHQLMNPLAQLFGIMLEKMPGYVAPGAWATNPDKLIGQREDMASDLLFRKGLQACHQAAREAFFTTKMGATVVRTAAGPGAAGGTGRTGRPNKPALDPSAAAAAPKKQASLDIFMKQSAFIDDSRLAQAMARAKRVAKRSTEANKSPENTEEV